MDTLDAETKREERLPTIRLVGRKNIPDGRFSQDLDAINWKGVV